MKTLLLFPILQCLLWRSEAADLRLPPEFTTQPRAEYVYKSGDTLVLECEATGIPDPEYSWTRDGEIVEISKQISKIGTGGSIQISPANTYFHDGKYQCKAYNKYGAALSRTAMVQQAKTTYVTRSDPLTRNAGEGEPFRLDPSEIECFPQPRYTWKTVTDIKTNADPRDIVPNKRITLNAADGALLFANVVPDDQKAGRIYKLDVHNSVDDLTQGGSPYMITVTPRSGGSNTKPTVMAPKPGAEEFEYVGIKGKNVTLMCFFGGYPTPELGWKFPPNPPPPSRIDCTKESNTRCEVKHLEYRDEGQFVCTGSNAGGSTQLKINLKIESIPTFTKLPMNTNATEGRSAVFECEADAKPTAKIEWFSNGNLIDPQSPGNSRIIVNNNKLTVQRVCKDCDGTHGTDIQVFQCKISNIHGEAVASAYLNVLLPTEIYETSPLNVELDPTDGSEVGMMANFTCRARTDPLIEGNLKIQWWHEKTRIYPEQGPYQLSENDKFLEINLNRTTEKIQKLAIGKYKCVAQTSQNNEEDFKIFSLTIKTLEVTINKETPVRAAMIEQMWWLFVVLALIFLLLICCMSCCLYAYRDRGADYEVDDKERIDGNDLEADLAELEFTEYQRPFESATLWKGSRASLGSTRHLDKSADETSIFTDHGRFEEDGMSADNYTGSRRQLMVPHHSLSRTTVPDW